MSRNARSRSLQFAAALMIVVLAAGAVGQMPTPTRADSRARLDEVVRGPAESNRIVGLQERASDALLARIADPGAYWTLLTSPDTAFVERATAAYQGARFFPYEQLPRLMTTLGELRAEKRDHNWGLRPNPSSGVVPEQQDWWRTVEARMGSRTDAERSRTVLGHTWRVPSTVQGWAPGPDDLAEAEAAPWPAQIEIALEILLRAAAPFMTENCDPAVVLGNVRWLEAALRLPCGTDDEALLFVEAAQSASHHVDERVLARYRTLVLDDRYPRSAERILSGIGESPRLALCADPATLPQIQVLLIDALRGTLRERVRDNAAYALRGLREQWNREAKRAEPATLILLASERGTSGTAATAWHDAYVYLFSACEAMDAPPFVPDRHARTETAPTWISTYRTWLAANRADLERKAAAETPTLDGARARLIALEAR